MPWQVDNFADGSSATVPRGCERGGQERVVRDRYAAGSGARNAHHTLTNE
ncbi:hypothetical protein GCM10009663_74040 [Kitasatospora arboriphila]|uniref:Uncharacterized protein n=1 Tax=Kitasatospora arboriphila TaxID=258052 RepID=A0ABN1U6B7_9ACTN